MMEMKEPEETEIIRKTLINGKEDPILEDCITTKVTQRESKIWDAMLIANDEKGKTFLGTVDLEDEVTVKFKYKDKPGDSWHILFKGKVVELQPEMNIKGEICSVKAYGTGVGLKRMRVPEEYGTESKYGFMNKVIFDDNYFVDQYTTSTHEWNLVGSSPFLQDGDSDHIYVDWLTTSVNDDLHVANWTFIHNDFTHVNDSPWLHDDDESNYITEIADPSAVGHYDEYYEFETLGLPSGEFSVSAVSLKVKAKLFDGVNGHASMTLRFYCWDGSTWWSGAWPFTSTDWETVTFNFSCLDTLNKINNARLKIEVESVSGGGSGKGGIKVTYAYLHVEGTVKGGIGKTEGKFRFVDTEPRSFLLVDYLWLEIRAKVDPPSSECYITVTLTDSGPFPAPPIFLPPKKITGGWEWYIYDCKDAIDIDNLNDYNMEITLYGTDSTSARLTVSSACWYYKGWGHDGSISTLRQIMTNSIVGIIPKYVEKYLGSSGRVPSKWEFNTDYIWNWDYEFKFFNFQYEPAFNCINDITSIAAAASYPNPGIHWIVLPDGQLCMAPIGNHNVSGITTEYNINDVWPTWSRITPIEVKKEMITTQFRKSEMEANRVIVNGIVKLGGNDMICEGNANQWEHQQSDGKIYNSTADPRVGLQCIQLASWQMATYRFRCPLSFQTYYLGSEKNVPTVTFWFKVGGATSNHKIFFIFGTNWESRIEFDLSRKGVKENEWVFVEIEIGPNSKDEWSSRDWSAISYVGFSFDAGFHAGEEHCWVDGLRINGKIVRVSYNSTSIDKHGCKEKLITDSLSETYQYKDAEDDSCPLGQVAKAELIRAMKTPLTGIIQIPLDPLILPGQLVMIRACRKETGFNIDENTHPGGFRITEVTHAFGISGATTTLSLTDDLTNSVPIGPADAYIAILKASNPDFQDRDRASIKAASVDKDLMVLAKDYPAGD